MQWTLYVENNYKKLYNSFTCNIAIQLTVAIMLRTAVAPIVGLSGTFHSCRRTCLLLLSFSRQSDHKLPLSFDTCVFATSCTCLFTVMACTEIVVESGPLESGRLSSANGLVVLLKSHANQTPIAWPYV